MVIGKNIVPFITEEVYQENYRTNEGGESIHTSAWPTVKEFSREDLDGLHKFAALVKIVGNIRQEKSNAQKAMNSEIKLTLPKEDLDLIGEMIDDLKDVAVAQEVSEGEFAVEFFEKTG